MQFIDFDCSRLLADKLAAEDLMIELGKEVERLRSESGPAMPTTSPETLRLEELHQELEELRQAKKALIEQNEELQAMVLTRGVEEGRNLLNGTSNSLAQELDELNDRQVMKWKLIVILGQLEYVDRGEREKVLLLILGFDFICSITQTTLMHICTHAHTHEHLCFVSNKLRNSHMTGAKFVCFSSLFLLFITTNTNTTITTLLRLSDRILLIRQH